MKKALLICEHYPFPENIGTNMRTMAFVRFFKNKGTVDIAYSNIFNDSPVGNNLFLNEYRIQNRQFKNYKMGLIYRFIKRVPVPINCPNRASQTMLLSKIEFNDYDYIIIRYLHNSAIILRMSEKYRKRTILDYDDMLSDSLLDPILLSTEGHIKNAILNIIKTLNKKILLTYENKCLRAGITLFCSEKDMTRINDNRNTCQAFVAPNTYDNVSFEEYDFEDGYNRGNTLIFVGTLGYQPNTDGLKWFIESVFPSFRDIYPDARLLIIGRFPSHEIIKLCSERDWIELHADVPDVKDYYRQCRAVIVPLLSGGGTRIKILEAALARRPVFSTSVGSEGLDFTDGSDIISFRDAQEFSSQYARLNDRVIYDSIVSNARKKVLNRYAPQRFYETMDQVLKEIEKTAQH